MAGVGNSSTLADPYNGSAPNNLYNSSINVTTEPDLYVESTKVSLQFYEVKGWIDLGIRILGLITNPMILIVLSRQKIGSKYILLA